MVFLFYCQKQGSQISFEGAKLEIQSINIAANDGVQSGE